MSTRVNSTVTAVLGGLLILTPAGCEDPEAGTRVEVQQAIRQASLDFRRATVAPVDPADDEFVRVREDLDRLVRDLDGVRDGSAGQQSAKSMLAAQVLQTLGEMSHRESVVIERDLRRQRQAIVALADAARRLSAQAGAHEGIDVREHAAFLQQHRQQAEAMLQDLRAQLQELDQPIAERSRRIDEFSQSARELQEAANELLREAGDLGYAAGFEVFQDAIEARRRADRFEYDIAKNEIDLEYEFRPRHQLAAMQRRHVETLIEVVQNTVNELQAYEQVLAESVSTLRGEVRTRRDEIHRIRRDVAERMDGDLAAMYEDAGQRLDRAASEARQAAGRLRGAEANAARILEARVLDLHARMLRSRAIGINDEIRMLSRLIDAGDVVGETRALRDRRTQWQETLDADIEQARELLQRASGSLDQVTGRDGDTVRGFRRAVENTLAGLAGEAVQWDDPGASGASGASGAEPGPRGFETAEQLVEYLNGLDPDDMAGLTAVIHAESPEARRMVRAFLELGEAVRAFEQAVEGHFGVDLAEAGMGDEFNVGMDSGGLQNVRIINQMPNRARVTAGAPGMPQDTFELVRVDESWFLDGESMLAASAQHGMSAEQSLQMLEAMAGTFSGLAQRVQGGEFNSPEQLFGALMQEVLGGMDLGEFDFEDMDEVDLPPGFPGQ